MRVTFKRQHMDSAIEEVAERTAAGTDMSAEDVEEEIRYAFAWLREHGPGHPDYEEYSALFLPVMVCARMRGELDGVAAIH